MLCFDRLVENMFKYMSKDLIPCIVSHSFLDFIEYYMETSSLIPHSNLLIFYSSNSVYTLPACSRSLNGLYIIL